MRAWLPLAAIGVLLVALVAALASSSVAAHDAPPFVAATAASKPEQPGARSSVASGTPTAADAQNAAGLTALHFADARQGWLAGLGLILATTDGGQTWAPQFSTTDPISSFAFVDARTGWAVGARSLVATTDGGQRWERRADAAPPLASVSFATAALGWGIPTPRRALTGGDAAPAEPAPAHLLATDDAGQTWATVAAPGPLRSICRANAEQGWVAGNGRVWRQASAGASWTLTLTSPAAAQVSAPEGLGAGFGGEVQCLDGDTAWVLFTAPGGMMQTGWALYRTGDAGATWTPVAQSGQFFPATGAPHGASGWNRVRLAAVDATTAYVIGTCVPCSPPDMRESGTISLGVSRDAGQSWQDLPPLPDAFGQPIVSAPFAASFPSPTHGWLIAPGSASLYATTDGGATWTSRPLDMAR
jgi:photosystem II stability/assembly factor-like uncharacterized protein